MTGKSSNASPPARTSDADVSETDLAQQRMGNNQLQGNDQDDVRNQRHAVPDVKMETDGVVESFEKLDPKVRSNRENQE